MYIRQYVFALPVHVSTSAYPDRVSDPFLRGFPRSHTYSYRHSSLSFSWIVSASSLKPTFPQNRWASNFLRRDEAQSINVAKAGSRNRSRKSPPPVPTTISARLSTLANRLAPPTRAAGVTILLIIAREVRLIPDRLRHHDSKSCAFKAVARG